MDTNLPTEITRGESLDAKVAFLRQPTSYPDHPHRVDCIETHMSWVFLTHRYVYKLKKPVKYDFLDFGSRSARRRNCEEEIRLNRRLAPETYFGIVALSRADDGTLQIGSNGKVVDWLVKMRRLPAERMLDVAIRKNTVKRADIQRCADVLAAFYRRSAPVKMSGADYRSVFAERVSENQQALANPQFGLPAEIVRRVGDRQLAFIDAAAPVFDRRAADGKIIEGHGDLRPEHICLGPTPQIIDCLEFNRAFRILDPVDELGFLSMECAFLGAPFVEQILFDTYRAVTEDAPPDALLSFYQCYRACLRAKLSVWHLLDANVEDPAKWTARGRQYLDIADRHARALAKPV